MKYFFILPIFLVLLLVSSKLYSQDNSKFYIDGQIHPAYSIKIVINGKLVREVIPDKEKVKIFVFDLDKNIIKSGQNTVAVQYNVLRKIEQEVGSSRSFRFNIRYQADIDDNSTVEKLIKIKGIEKPFPPVGTSDKMIETFEYSS